MATIHIALIGLLIIYVSHAAQTTPSCPTGWVIGNGNCYKFVNTRVVTYKQAQAECTAFDAGLLSFENANELSWFVRTVPTQPSAAYWTALNDITPGGTVKSQGTGRWRWGSYMYADMTYLTWNISPANDGMSNCGALNIQGRMADLDCSNTQGYICSKQKPLGGSCPNQWQKTATSCYWVSNTADPSQLLTWAQAKTKCSTLNTAASLLAISSGGDMGFLTSQLQKLSLTSKVHWTGLHRVNNAWSWDNGATFVQLFFQWQTEPDNLAGVENCGVVRYNGHLSDRDCTSRHNYVCKAAADVSTATVNLGCDTWIRAGSMCYNFYAGHSWTWSQARAKCQASHGDLLSVKDLDISLWLREQMFDPHIASTEMWTGLTDTQTEGTYVWTDGSKLAPNTINWNSEPNNWEGFENCAVVWGPGIYNDVRCDNKAAAICELDIVAGSCPTRGGTWLTRPADSGSGINCYLFTDYKNSSSWFTQSEASSYCGTLGISATAIPALLTVNTAAEWTFIKTQLTTKYTNNFKGFYTSLNDKTLEGYWQYTVPDLITPTVPINWAKEPNNYSPDNDCCVIEYAGTYHMRNCNFKAGAVCQRPANLAASGPAHSSTGPAVG